MLSYFLNKIFSFGEIYLNNSYFLIYTPCKFVTQYNSSYYLSDILCFFNVLSIYMFKFLDFLRFKQFVKLRLDESSFLNVRNFVFFDMISINFFNGKILLFIL